MNKSKKIFFTISMFFLLSILLKYKITSTHKYTIVPKKYDANCPEKKIAVIIPSYNNQKWYQENLDSVTNQNYENFYVIYVNDFSKDNTALLVEEYIKNHNLEKKFKLINNKKRIGSLANVYKAVHLCNNKTIVILLDGDDKFAHNNVLKIINSYYQNSDIWTTYGQYIVMPDNKIFPCTKYSKHEIENNLFRKGLMRISHPKTFYAGLFKLINKKDFLYNGEFYPMTGDKAMMMPIIEMAGHRHKCISDILYIYNNANPINVHKINYKLQVALENEIRNKKPYTPVTWEDVASA